MLCPSCNTNVADGASFCENCGAALTGAAPAAAAAQPAAAAPQGEPQQQYQQPSYQQPQYQQGQYQQPYYQQPQYQQGASGQVGAKSKIAAGLLGIFLGGLGIHKFYLGYTQAGVIMLVVTLVGGILTLGVAAAVMGIIGLIEGIMYLVKSDYDFYQTYEIGQKQWF